MIDGTKWGGGLGTGVTLTYSFPTGTAYYDDSFGYSEWYNWDWLSSGERAAVRDALSVWAKSANIKFVEVADNFSTVGELRFAYTKNIDPGAAAHAYLPDSYAYAGDVWFSYYGFNSPYVATISRGSFDYMTILHEIGHALGLKHSFESPNAIPDKLDNYFYTIMSYTASPWSAENDNYSSFAPTTPMYYDLLAIEALYGKNTTVNTGNDTYTFKDGTRYWQAINDARGNDAIVYSGSENSSINLNPGAFSAVSEKIFFSGSASSRATVTIGPGVVIENARGGNGNDSLVGNGTANSLRGGAGNDTVSGGAGNDALSGETGKDTVTGGAGKDAFIFNTALSAATNIDRITDFSVADDTIRLENAVFTALKAIGTLAASAFCVGAAARDADDRIIYNKTTGALTYDANGKAAGGAVQFATLGTGPALTNADFAVV